MYIKNKVYNQDQNQKENYYGYWDFFPKDIFPKNINPLDLGRLKGKEYMPTNEDFKIFRKLVEDAQYDKNFKMSIDMDQAYPKINSGTNEHGIVIQCFVPGLSKEDISIEIEEQNFLIISSKDNDSHDKCSNPNETLYKVWDIREFDDFLLLKKFKRKVLIHSAFDIEKVQASCINGILTITIPRKKSKEKIVSKVNIS